MRTIFLFLSLCFFWGCQKVDTNLVSETAKIPTLPNIPYEYSFEGDFQRSNINSRFIRFDLRALRLRQDTIDSSLSDEKVELGRVLFYDQQLSLNNTVSCGTCHKQEKAFADDLVFSKGLNNKIATRNTLPLSNLGFQGGYFWDFRARELEKQVMMPIQNHIEMGIEHLDNLPPKLMRVDYYPALFEKAYGSNTINTHRISTALAQFLAAMISNKSKYDEEVGNSFTNYTYLEKLGWDIFTDKGKCDRCHYQPLFTNSWSTQNIGLDIQYEDNGAGSGRFKVPSLRNIELTAPYMHDGRFKTLEEVIDHYNEGIQPHPNLDYVLIDHSKDGTEPIKLHLSGEERSALVAFLKTLTDYEFIRDERFSDPFK